MSRITKDCINDDLWISSKFNTEVTPVVNGFASEEEMYEYSMVEILQFEHSLSTNGLLEN